MPTLPFALPPELWWLTAKVESLVRPAAFLLPDSAAPAPLGGTRTWGRPDLPRDWRLPDLHDSPYDGECCWGQLNLADIPAAARRPDWPTQGVVWLTIDLSGSWRSDVYYDPRPSSAIPWRPRVGTPPPAARWQLADTLPGCTETTLPELWPLWRQPDSLVAVYDDWVQQHYGPPRSATSQVGGWVWPCQGDHDERNASFVWGLENQPFGDCGAVYLHFTPAAGFHSFVETH